MDVFIKDMFLLIEMAHKTKKTLTRAQLRKVRAENAQKGEESRGGEKKGVGRKEGG